MWARGILIVLRIDVELLFFWQINDRLLTASEKLTTPGIIGVLHMGHDWSTYHGYRMTAQRKFPAVTILDLWLQGPSGNACFLHTSGWYDTQKNRISTKIENRSPKWESRIMPLNRRHSGIALLESSRAMSKTEDRSYDKRKCGSRRAAQCWTRDKVILSPWCLGEKQ